ncbi:DUF2199 domain-containing protein [Gymnodinialimonas hymeniacidonis]|uniref:DUF2199 domain-containing protein n=1 Tax=Gymnodinialimonas hymeniacidonis TaxID=3126508 RepID=UPI0034C6B69D
MIRKLFRRDRPAPELPEAELARRLVDRAYRCACCDKEWRAADGAFWPAAPFGWKNPPEPKEDETFELGYMEMLTDSYARRDGNFLLRAFLPIPVKDTDSEVFLGVWCSLSSGNHARFRSAQQRGDAQNMGDQFSWLYTQLPPISGPLLTKGVLVPYSEGRTPLYWITDEKHPLYQGQQEGMRAGEILELYETLGCGEVVQHLKA